MTDEEIDDAAGNDFILQLQVRGSGDVHAIRSPGVPSSNAVLSLEDGRKVRIDSMLHQRGREVFLGCSYVSTVEPATTREEVGPPPVTAIRHAYEVGHRSQVRYGATPTTPWTILIRHAKRQAVDLNDVADELKAIAARLNATTAHDADLTEAERLHLAIITNNAPGTGYDSNGKFVFPVRRIDAVYPGSRRPVSRRELARTAPTLAAFLDTENGTAGDPLPMSAQEQQAADEAARDAADEAQRQADQERRERLDREGLEEVMADAMEALGIPDRRRAAALLNVVYRLATHERPAAVADFLVNEDHPYEIAA